MSYDPYKPDEQIQIEILKNIIDLDEVCHRCTEGNNCSGYGGDPEPTRISGYRKGYKNGEPCDYCDGKRFVLTEAGQAIINLIKRHGVKQ